MSCSSSLKRSGQSASHTRLLWIIFLCGLLCSRPGRVVVEAYSPREGPGGGGIEIGGPGLKIIESNTPLPQDRLLLNYNWAAFPPPPATPTQNDIDSRCIRHVAMKDDSHATLFTDSSTTWNLDTDSGLLVVNPPGQSLPPQFNGMYGGSWVGDDSLGIAFFVNQNYTSYRTELSKFDTGTGQLLAGPVNVFNNLNSAAMTIDRVHQVIPILASYSGQLQVFDYNLNLIGDSGANSIFATPVFPDVPLQGGSSDLYAVPATNGLFVSNGLFSRAADTIVCQRPYNNPNGIFCGGLDEVNKTSAHYVVELQHDQTENLTSLYLQPPYYSPGVVFQDGQLFMSFYTGYGTSPITNILISGNAAPGLNNFVVSNWTGESISNTIVGDPQAHLIHLYQPPAKLLSMDPNTMTNVNFLNFSTLGDQAAASFDKFTSYQLGFCE